jgi:hypothetical protein
MEACRKIFIEPKGINVLSTNEIIVDESADLSWSQNAASGHKKTTTEKT